MQVTYLGEGPRTHKWEVGKWVGEGKEANEGSDIEQVSVLGNWASHSLEKCGRKLFQSLGFVLFRDGKPKSSGDDCY